ncbi:UNVERIFIED_ORG: hypothetical protein DFS12_109152 [Chitinophaga ginsengisegetis]
MYNVDLRMTGYISVGQDVISLLSKFFIAVGLTFLTATVFAQEATVNLQKEVTVPVADMRLDALLTLVSKQAGIRFSVNTRKFPTSRTVHVKKGPQSLLRLLTDLREHTGIDYRVLGGHIIFVDALALILTKKNPAVVKQERVTPPARFVIIPVSPVTTKQTDAIFPALDTVKTDTGYIRPKAIAFPPVPQRYAENGNTPIAGGVKRNGPVFSLKPYAAAGMVADESFYVNPTIQAGLPFLYALGSWSTNFSFSMLRYGAGTSIRLSDSWRLHLQGTTGNMEAGYDSLGYIQKTVKVQLHKLALVGEKQIGNHWRLQLGAVLNSLQTAYYTDGKPAALKMEESEALAHVKYFKPPYTISNNFSPDATRSNKLWIGFQIGIFYRLNFYKE